MPDAVGDLRGKLIQLQKALADLQARTADDARAKAKLSFLLVSCRDAMERLNEANPRNLAKALRDVDEMVGQATAFCKGLEGAT